MKGVPIPEAVAYQMAEQAKAGWSTQRIAAKYGFSHSGVRRSLLRIGVRCRGVPGPRADHLRELPLARAMYERGERLQAITAATGLSERMVRSMWERYRWTRPTKAVKIVQPRDERVYVQRRCEGCAQITNTHPCQWCGTEW